MGAWMQIENWMTKNRLSAKEIAEISGVAPSAVTKWKAGGGIKLDALRRLSVHFGVPVEEILTGKSVKENQSSASDAIQNAGAPLCRYPADCDLVRELAEMRNGLATLSAQVNTLTQLLGASLRSSIEAPEKKAG